MGQIQGQLRIGPHVRLVGGDFWPVINIAITDDGQTVAVDFPIGTAPSIIAELQKIIMEYGNGSDVPQSWDLPGGPT